MIICALWPNSVTETDESNFRKTKYAHIGIRKKTVWAFALVERGTNLVPIILRFVSVGAIVNSDSLCIF